MTGLLEIKDKLVQFYSKYATYIVPCVKFLLAFVIFQALNGQLGYMAKIDNIAIVLIVALMCSFLPVNLMIVLAAVFSLAHLYALSLEVALVGLCLYLVLFLLYFRFSPKDSLLVVLVPILFGWKIPYVAPIAAGLLCGPTAVVSLVCGTVVSFFLDTVVSVAPTLNTMGADEMMGKVRLVVDGIIGNKSLLVIAVAFALTALIVYAIRRLSLDHSWTIAIVVGAITEVMVLLIGDLMYDINISVAGALIGAILAILVGKIIEFFRFCVDYSRTEHVQYEDDEYYYYVKAVPKMTVSAPAKTVKRINTQRGQSQHYQAHQGQTRGGNAYGAARQNNDGHGRSVVVERTRTGGMNDTRRTERNYGQGVTVGNIESDLDDQDFYEDI